MNAIDTNVKKPPAEWIRKYARFGMFAKGVVYILIGGLTTFAAFNAGGKTTGKGGAFQFIMGQPFGKVILGLIALGLLGYVTWRFIQAIKDPESEGGWRRAGYAASGIFYIIIAFSAARMIFSGGGDSNSDKQTQLVSSLLENSMGQVLVGIVALIFFGKAIWQFYRAFSGKFKSKLKDTGLDEKARQTVQKTGFIGYISRGIVIGIIGFLFLKAAWQANSSQAGGTKEAFSVLESSVGGPILLGIVSLGLVAYGVFMFVKGHYRVMPSL